MSNDRWSRISRVCQEALNRDAAERASFLESACGGDLDLRREVEALLAQEARADGFLSTPPWDSAKAGGAGPDTPAGRRVVVDQADARPPLGAGTHVGHYEVIDFIGAGGMGEVYRARDTRLDRIVALKRLPPAFAADPGRVTRFTREARTLAQLNHPNICTLHDVVAHEGTTVLVMEYLTGETLAARLRRRPLSLAVACELAARIADALAAAHRLGIVHRDLKPANIMLSGETADRSAVPHVKLLDFGLATFQGHVDRPSLTTEVTAPTRSGPLTANGTVVGTLPYMAPEQVEGKPVDARSDIWALGTILYEMIAGRRAFAGDSAVSLMGRILESDPSPLSAAQPLATPALERLVARCLAKDPAGRWQAASDVAAELRWLAQPDSGVGVVKTSPRASRRRAAAALVALAAVAVAATLATLTYFAGRAAGVPTPLTFTRLTYRRGWVNAARFAPDGHTAIYSAVWDGGRSEVFSRRFDSRESQSLDHPSADLMAVSSSGELALALDSRVRRDMHAWAGTLATVSQAAGTPHPLEQQVSFADWSPDGRTLAIVRQTDTADTLEFPPGHKLYSSVGSIFSPRVSSSGDRVAFIESLDGVIGPVIVVDLHGGRKVLAGNFRRGLPSSLAWSTKGDEVWFGALRNGLTQEVRAVSLDGRQRLVYRESGSVRLLDVAKDGRALVSHDRPGGRGFFRGEGESTDRELSWLDDSYLGGLSRDGRFALINEQGDGAGPEGSDLYVRDTSGKPPAKLGPGLAFGFTGHDQFVAAAPVDATNPAIVLYPVSSGLPQRILVPGITVFTVAGLVPPDHQTIAFTGNEPSRGPRIWLMPRDGASKPRAISPEGVYAMPSGAIPPDGSFVVGLTGDLFHGKVLAYPTAEGEPQPIKGLLEGDAIAGWSDDGRSFFAYATGEAPWQVYRVDRKSGARVPFRTVSTTDRSGRLFASYLFITPDGTSYGYTTCRWQSELHVIEGLK